MVYIETSKEVDNISIYAYIDEISKFIGKYPILVTLPVTINYNFSFALNKYGEYIIDYGKASIDFLDIDTIEFKVPEDFEEDIEGEIANWLQSNCYKEHENDVKEERRYERNKNKGVY